MKLIANKEELEAFKDVYIGLSRGPGPEIKRKGFKEAIKRVWVWFGLRFRW
jgi:hypothetical protein